MRLALQARRRLIRDALAATLQEELGVTVTALRNSSQLVGTCAAQDPGVVVMELHDTDSDVVIARSLVRRQTSLRLIGISHHRGPERNQPFRNAGFHAIVAQEDGVAGVVRAIRRTTLPPPALPATRRGSSSAGQVLTPREVEVLDLVAAGLTTGEAGERLHIEAKTIENHKQHIFWKLGVHNQAHAVATAMQWGVIPASPEAAG